VNWIANGEHSNPKIGFVKSQFINPLAQPFGSVQYEERARLGNVQIEPSCARSSYCTGSFSLACERKAEQKMNSAMICHFQHRAGLSPALAV
jgi:hypothetical protein